jgi:hypothetical protein
MTGSSRACVSAMNALLVPLVVLALILLELLAAAEARGANEGRPEG